MTALEIILAALVVGCAIAFCSLLFIYLSSNKVETSNEEVKEVELNISEPVLSFIETFKNNHRRFLITLVGSSEYLGYSRTKNYTLLDKKKPQKNGFVG